ncbi:ectonucleotide pyrophosphatase/phosphodiesterase [Maribacter polysaccharolyticus]|uniref:alkaline phosphatase family protein n=1 Tax=Maribacter polysaccharolyticus TaxID=3020831 RepID=UPI00237F435E|nr:ectonucleotide pyrophosphatase/phosphodiesterase [Maribacter polysaccharolyticus]MDE3740200.1 ectonucleotide pyrophosphatase/phosphodiesterase [Maribacter polysaccharolyticus]
MGKRNFIYAFIVLLVTLNFSACKSGYKVTEPTVTQNSEISLQKPYVILVSLDGFRWDYVDKYKPPYLTEFIRNGVQAESLIPSFPSKTFPNHYTIATGIYPDKHGIIANTFYSYKKGVTYKTGNREMVEDGTFYGGTPLWVLAEKSDMVSASYFFVGSEADVKGVHPTYYHKYDGKIENEVRVSETLKWLQLPENERPHMITLYFSDMDDTGHKFSPDNEERIKKALFALDENLGTLFKGVAATGLPANIIVVSDHGMATLPTTHMIPVEEIKNDGLFTVINSGAILNIHPKETTTTEAVLDYLKQKEDHFKVYRTADTPGFEYQPKNKDWGSIQIIPDFGYYFSSKKGIESLEKRSVSRVGVHGYDPIYKDMHGIFYANGPSFKKGYVAPAVKNIHIYPLICEILGLDIPTDIDGDLNVLKSVLKSE